MKIEFEGRTWQLDELDITNRQAAYIREYTGLSVQKWFDSFKDTDAPAWESRFDALYWLMLQQNPQHGTPPVGIPEVDYPVYKFLRAYMEAYLAEHPEAAKAAEPDPTQPTAASEPSPGPSSRKASSGRAGGVKPHG